MKFTFVSNYINHHQLPMAKEMYQALGDEYAFIETEPITEERLQLGWGESDQIPFLHRYYEAEEACKKLIMDSDIVMFGGVDDERYLEERLKAKKPVIRYAERFYKDGRYKAISPRGLMKKWKDHTRYRKAPVYLLCAGAYVAGDYQIIQAYPKKKFTWGYFPEKKTYTREQLFEKKYGNEVSKDKKRYLDILWAGRFIDWKHPEYVLELAKRLKKETDIPEWKITMIGGGLLEEKITKMAKKYQIEDKITFTGTMKPNKVREHMEGADIYLFTSDYGEGWGAVMNEAMNSGCSVVANKGIGAAHSLIQSGVNGFLYPNKKFEIFYQQVLQLMKEDALRTSIAEAAYRTIDEMWNPQYASQQLIALSEAILKEYSNKGARGKYRAPMDFPLPKTGPMSKAVLH